MAYRDTRDPRIELLAAQIARRDHDSPFLRAGLTVAAFAALDPTFVDIHKRESEALAARTRSHLPLASERLAALVPALEQLRQRFDLWPDDPSLARACARLAERSEDGILERALAPTLASLEQISSALATERNAIMRHRDELAARQRRMFEPSPEFR